MRCMDFVVFLCLMIPLFKLIPWSIYRHLEKGDVISLNTSWKKHCWGKFFFSFSFHEITKYKNLQKTCFPADKLSLSHTSSYTLKYDLVARGLNPPNVTDECTSDVQHKNNMQYVFTRNMQTVYWPIYVCVYMHIWMYICVYLSAIDRWIDR